MNDSVDPRIDKMVAYLYGELPEAEERAFRRLLEKDDALRTEYEELAGTRETLRGWEVEESVPSFVLVEGTATERERRATPVRVSLWDRLVAPFRSLAISPAWGLAAAAALLLVLGAFGFRVETVDGGLAFRFGNGSLEGEPTEPSAELATAPSEALPIQLPENTAVPVGSYLTAKDLESYDANLMLTLAELLNAYSRQRDREVSEGFQSLYQQVSSERTYDYEQLAGRIDVLGQELILESDRNARGFREVLQNRPDYERSNEPLEDEEE